MRWSVLMPPQMQSKCHESLRSILAAFEFQELAQVVMRTQFLLHPGSCTMAESELPL